MQRPEAFSRTILPVFRACSALLTARFGSIGPLTAARAPRGQSSLPAAGSSGDIMLSHSAWKRTTSAREPSMRVYACFSSLASRGPRCRSAAPSLPAVQLRAANAAAAVLLLHQAPAACRAAVAAAAAHTAAPEAPTTSDIMASSGTPPGHPGRSLPKNFEPTEREAALYDW